MRVLFLILFTLVNLSIIAQDRGCFGIKNSVGFNGPSGNFGLGIEYKPLNNLGIHASINSGNKYQGFGFTGGFKIYPVYAQIAPYVGLDFSTYSENDFIYISDDGQETDLLMPQFTSYRISMGIRSDIGGKYKYYPTKEFVKFMSFIVSVHYQLQNSPAIIYEGGYNNIGKIDAINKLSMFRWGVSFDFIFVFKSRNSRKEKNIPLKKWFFEKRG